MRKGRWTRDEEQFVRENYLQMSDEEIADILDINEGSVKSKRYLLGCRRQEPGRRWSDEEVNSLRDNPTKSDRELGQMLGRTMYAVHAKRMSKGILRSKQFEAKYEVNLNFFKDWSQEMAYVLGLFFADGYVYVRESEGYEAGIGFKDRKILEKINTVMKSNYPIKEYTKDERKFYIIRFFRKEIVQDLIKLGVVPKKSLIMKFPDIPENYFFSFIRGYFDGDGTVRRIGRYLQLNIASGSKAFAEAMQQQFVKRGISFSLYIRKKNRKNTLYELQARSETSREFCVKMYENATIFLERKHEIIQEFLDQKPNLSKCVDCDKEIIQKHKKHIICPPCARIRMNHRSKLAKRRVRAKLKKNV